MLTHSFGVIERSPKRLAWRLNALGSRTSPPGGRRWVLLEFQDLAVRYGAAWAAHDVDAIMALHTEDTVFHLHGGGEPAVGRTATREAFAKAMEEWPDIGFERKRVHIGSGTSSANTR